MRKPPAFPKKLVSQLANMLPRLHWCLLIIMASILYFTLLFSPITQYYILSSTGLLNDTSVEQSANYQVSMLPEHKENLEKRGLTGFIDMMSKQDRAIMMNLTNVLTDALEKSNITYFINGGTLLGSWRHHDIIPWDDDIDIYVAEKDRYAIRLCLKKLQPDYTLVRGGTRFKLYSKRSKKTTHKYKWSWPFVDISMYTENSSHLWDITPGFSKFKYRKDKVFPTHRRPLGNLNLHAPRDSFAMLKEYYWPYSDCISTVFVLFNAQVLLDAHPLIREMSAPNQRNVS